MVARSVHYRLSLCVVHKCGTRSHCSRSFAKRHVDAHSMYIALLATPLCATGQLTYVNHNVRIFPEICCKCTANPLMSMLYRFPTLLHVVKTRSEPLCSPMETCLVRRNDLLRSTAGQCWLTACPRQAWKSAWALSKNSSCSASLGPSHS